MVMFNPPHPGEVIRELCIEPLGLTVTEAAKGLGVSRKTLSALLNGRFGISPKWPFGFPRLLESARKAGLLSRPNMTCGRLCKKPMIPFK